MRDRERHGSGRIGWLRAAVLGANDGIVSTASLVLGVAAGGGPPSAILVAAQLMARNALEAHARDELGISNLTRARPVQAAFASAGSFAAGAAVPVGVAWLAPASAVAAAVTIASLALLVLLGAIAAHAGGASPARGALRVGFWGALAMAITYGWAACSARAAESTLQEAS